MKLILNHFKSDVIRIVESQSYISTRQLVDSDAEQYILEDILDASKPSYPQTKNINSIHYLLKTPFRYPPLKYGSRFGSINYRGIFYASLELETCLCEAAYCRFIFLRDTTANLRPAIIPYTCFHVLADSTKNLDLTDEYYNIYQDRIRHKSSYQFTQKIGMLARENNFTSILYKSARLNTGTNIAILTPDIFAGKKPKKFTSLQCYMDDKNISFNYNLEEKFSYIFEIYYLNGSLCNKSSKLTKLGSCKSPTGPK